MTTTFENAKVGDRVYSLAVGWAKIISIEDYSFNGYPILLAGDAAKVLRLYNLFGSIYGCGDQVLFWDKPEIIAPSKPMEAPPVDTLVEVKLIHGWYKRYSAGVIEDGYLRVWPDGRTSHTSSDGDSYLVRYWRLIGDKS